MTYTDDLVPYAPLELCSFWGCGEVFHCIIVCEHDLTMDALLENGLSGIRCCYHSNIIYQRKCSKLQLGYNVLVAVTIAT